MYKVMFDTIWAFPNSGNFNPSVEHVNNEMDPGTSVMICIFPRRKITAHFGIYREIFSELHWKVSNTPL